MTASCSWVVVFSSIAAVLEKQSCVFCGEADFCLSTLRSTCRVKQSVDEAKCQESPVCSVVFAQICMPELASTVWERSQYVLKCLQKLSCMSRVMYSTDPVGSLPWRRRFCSEHIPACGSHHCIFIFSVLKMVSMDAHNKLISSIEKRELLHCSFSYKFCCRFLQLLPMCC